MSFPKLSLPIQPPFAPMEAKRVDKVPAGDRWQFEPKWDGFRCLAFCDGANIELQGKSGKSLARFFPDVVAALKSLSASRFVIDSELVIPVDGKTSFEEFCAGDITCFFQLARMDTQVAVGCIH